MNKNLILKELNKNIDIEKILLNESMKKHTSYKIGGEADIFVTVSDKEEINWCIQVASKNKIPYFVMGNGTNLLVSDAGFRGMIIYIGNKMKKIELEEDVFIAESGASLISLSQFAYKNGFTGLEFASGIPGTVGGAICMNAGAYEREIKDVLIEINAIDSKGNSIILKNGELKMTYRKTIISQKKYIVVSSKFRLEKGEKTTIKEKMDIYKEKRSKSQPLEFPNAGSVFKRPEGNFPGKLIDECGLKGYRIGDAEISTKHANFIINCGNATAKDVYELAMYVSDVVYEKTKIRLELEIKVLGDIYADEKSKEKLRAL